MPRSFGTTNAQRWATAPPVGIAGDLYFNTASNTLWISDGTAWQQVGGAAPSFPVGTIVMYGADAAPTGWLLCNGQAVSRTGYAALFAVLGTIYGGGDGSTTFTVPNFMNRVPRGLTRMASGGSDTHSHSLSAHTHAGPSHTHGAHDHVLDNGANFARVRMATSDGQLSMQAYTAAPSWAQTVSNTFAANSSATTTARTVGATLGGNAGAATPNADGTGATGAPSTDATDSQSNVQAYCGVVFIIKS